MAVPTLDTPYPVQFVGLNTPVNLDITTNWSSDAEVFEVNTLPPGFTFNGESLGGICAAGMQYHIAIRAGNSDGFAEWAELPWIVINGGTSRTVFGLPFLGHQSIPQASGSPATIFIRKATPSGEQSTWKAGLLILNDIPEDAGGACYDSSFIFTQIAFDGIGDLFIRATVPGWEIIITV